jgi:hypothetical protein
MPYKNIAQRRGGVQSIVEHICPVCGKIFIPAPYHAYHEQKVNGKLVCSYTCENVTRRDKA